MTQWDELREEVARLRGIAGPTAGFQAERLLGIILRPLLAHDGYTLEEPADQRGRQDDGVDFVAKSSMPRNGRVQSLGAQFKHYTSGRPVDVSSVREAIGSAILQPFDRFLLISTTGFTLASRQAARRVEPAAITLVGPDELDEWISRAQAPAIDPSSRVALLVRSISHEFAILVARDPEVLRALEWRDLERMMARILEGIGFKVTLTPSSKDGGKDLVLTCEVRDETCSYIVELKHWRSGKRVGGGAIREFLSVVAAERHSGGLFLSTSGYNSDALEELTEIEARRLRLGGAEKVVALAQTYVRANHGLWSPWTDLPETLFEDTQ